MCDLHNHCRHKKGLPSSYSLQTTQGKSSVLCSQLKKYTFKVMPFGTINAYSLYTSMMAELRIEWYELFLEKVRNRKVIGGMAVRVTDADEI